ncbi:MAG: hypothetical protein RIR11_715, partial [Bacteroidota bacterium]
MNTKQVCYLYTNLYLGKKLRLSPERSRPSASLRARREPSLHLGFVLRKTLQLKYT